MSACRSQICQPAKQKIGSGEQAGRTKRAGKTCPSNIISSMVRIGVGVRVRARARTRVGVTPRVRDMVRLKVRG